MDRGKFRVYNTKRGCYEDSRNHAIDCDGILYEFKHGLKPINMDIRVIEWSIDPRDSNDNLIFVGDIVKMAHMAFECYCTSMPCECSTIHGWTTGVVSVTTSNGVVLNRATFIDDEGEYSKKQGRVQMYVNRQKHVIGNIHKNPELLI